MTKPWYNVERVRQPGSVILKQWQADRNLARENQRKQKQSARMYAGAAINRLSGDYTALNSSADSEIISSLRVLRGRSRELMRDNEYAKNAVRIIKNNVIGTGVGMQAKVSTSGGKLITRINDQIEAAWEEWCRKDTCTPSGKLSFSDVELLIVGSLVENGEVLIRKVRQAFGQGTIPFALELIEADRLVDQWSVARASNGNTIRMGVEQDSWGRPVAYWLYPTHPGDYQFSAFVESALVRVPASEIIHLYVTDRIGQSRGVPWFHIAMKRLRNMGGYEEAEIVAARAAASIVGIIETPDELVPDNDDLLDGDGRIAPELSMTPGTFQQLAPGEKFTGFNPSRPNGSMDPFMRYMLRAVAAGVGTAYESLSRDYSRSNYSSSRLALLEDRDIWRVLQSWYIRNFRDDIHREWVAAAVLASALPFNDYYSNPLKYMAVRFKPRGWSWIDPTKEVAAYKEAVRCGFMTVSHVIAMTSEHLDLEDVMKERAAELAMMKELGLVFDTNPGQVDKKGSNQTPPSESEPQDGEENEEENPPDNDNDQDNDEARNSGP